MGSIVRRSPVFGALFFGSALAALCATRPITETDLLKFRWVADPQISPDGRQVAYVLVEVNEKEDRYDTSLWAVAARAGSEPRRLTAGPRDSAPRWSPDSSTLAFLRAAGEKERPQIHLLPMNGGDARRLTDLPRGASAAVWSPSGKTIAFTSGTTSEDLEEHRRDKEKGDSKEKPKKSDVRIVARAIYRSNGSGWLDPSRHEHVWSVAVTQGVTPEPRTVTSGRYDEGEVLWSRDGSKIYFTSDPVDEPYYEQPHSNLYAVSASGGPAEVVVDIAGPVSEPSLSSEGLRIAFVGFVNPREVQSHTRADLFVSEKGKAVPLTAGKDFEVGSGVGGDQHAPRGGSPGPLVWTPDGRSVILAVTEHGRSNLVRVDVAERKIEPLTAGDHDLMAYTATPDASRFAVTIGDDTHVGDLYLLETATKKLTRLTSVNDALFSELRLSEPEEFWYTSFDGKKINGWILKPPDFDPSRKYPLILEIHGGPHAAYGRTFTHEFQWMAAKGYVVLYTNPRGSTTYGQDFANIIQYRYPGDDYKDLMIGVDEAVKRGYVDEKRLGVTGGSGGGLLTNWTVTQTGSRPPSRSARSPTGRASGSPRTSRSSRRCGSGRTRSRIRRSSWPARPCATRTGS
jgi:dipeptidyl aminopeptidase/acylaminoacyl peptidase